MRKEKRAIIARQRRVQAVLACVLGCSGASQAQSVLTPTPGYSTTPPAVQAEEAQRTGLNLDWIPGALIPSAVDVFNWGPVVVHPRADYSVLYGSGLQSTPGQQSKTVIQEFSPGVLFVLGSHWTLNYSPTLTYYSSKMFNDSVDQSVSLNWGARYEDWSFGFLQAYATSSQPLVQTATQTATENYNTDVNVSYRFNSKMSLDADISQAINSADQFSSSRSWNTTEFLNYQFWSRLTAGIGGGYGYDSVNSGPDMAHEDLQTRLNWIVYRKMSFSIHGGVEDRQYLHSDVGNSISPTYGASITYQPLEFTALSLSLDRGISPSITSGDQASDTTSLSISLNQRLLKRLQLGIAGGYSDINYLASDLVLGNNRTDKLYSFSSSLTMAFLRRASVSLSYQYSQNTSTEAGFSFSSSQIGVHLDYSY